MKQLTGTQIQECTASQTSVAVSKPCNGLKSAVALDAEQPTTLLFTLDDVKGYDVASDGSLVIHFKDSSTLTVPNFQALADAGYSAKLEDGTVIEFANLIDDASAAGIKVDFTSNDIQSVTDSNGKLVIITKDGERHAFDHGKGEEVTFADGRSISPSELEKLFEVAAVEDAGKDLNEVEPAAGDVKKAAPTPKPQQVAANQPSAEDLAGIEPAAGEANTAPAGALRNTGANFGSGINGATIGPVADVGAIGPTSLQFGLPDAEFVQAGEPQAADPVLPPVPFPNPPLVDGIDKTVNEDGTVALMVTGSSSVTDGSEFIKVEILGIPATWTFTDLMGGVYDPTTGIWTIVLAPGQSFNGGPIIMPPIDSDVDLPLIVRVMTTNVATGLSTTVTDNFIVVVDAVVDQPIVNVQNVTTLEDMMVMLNLDEIDAFVTDIDDSESFTSIVLRGVPDGFILSAGTQNPDGSFTLTPAQLTNLKLTPPANFSGTVSLTVDITVTDTPTDQETNTTNNQLTVTRPLTVTFTPVADPAVLTATAQVSEDGSAMLMTSATLIDRDGSESMVVEIVGIPAGSITDLKGGTYNPATQTWTISVPAGQDFTGGPVVMPPANSDVDIPLTLRVITTDGTDTRESSMPFTYVVDAVADNVNLSAGPDVSGQAGQMVALNITTSLKDTDGSEEITAIRLTGIPDNVTLTAGTRNSDGSYSVTQAQLVGLKAVLPPAFARSFDVTVTVDSREKVTDGEFNLTNNTATLSDVVRVTGTFDPVAPTVSVNNGGDGRVFEDNSVVIPISVVGNGSNQETMVVTISNLPVGWVIDPTGLVGGTIVNNGTSITVTLPANTDLSGGIRFTPPANTDIDSPSITVSAVATEPATGLTASASDTFVIEVDAVADMPNLTVANVTGNEDMVIPLTIGSSLNDLDTSETLSIRITGLPVGATLTAGIRNADGSYTLTPAELANVGLRPAVNFSGVIDLVVTSTATETALNGVDFDLTNNVASKSLPLRVTVNPVADDPSFTINPAQVLEDNSVTLSVQATPTDPSESVMVTIGNLQGFTIPANGLNGGTFDPVAGVWMITLPAGVAFNGGPTIFPAANSDVNRDLSVTIKSTDGNSTNIKMGILPVVVDAVADNVTLSAVGGSGNQGSAIPVTISTSLIDNDGSEEITSVTITGVPDGVTLSAGVRNPDGSYTLTPAQLAGLTVNGGAFVGAFTAKVVVNSREKVTDTDFDLTNNTAMNMTNFSVSFAPNALPPVITVDPVQQVLEDNSVLVPLSVVGQGTAQETLMVTISNLPVGWAIDTSGLVGGVVVNNGTSIMVTLPANTDLSGGIRFTPPANTDTNSPSIVVTAVAKEANGTTVSATDDFVVVVDAVADGTNVTAPAMVMANEGTATIPVAIGATLRDTDGSEEITSVVITGIPAGVTLSAGTRNADGSYTLSAAQLAGLTVDPGNFVGEINAKVTVNSREKVTDTDFNLNNNTAMDMTNIQIVVKPVAKPPVITVDPVQQVFEDNSVLVPISVVGQGSDSETMMVTISNLPVGWTIDTSTLLGGTIVNNGTSIMVTLPANTDLSGGIRFTPPANSDIDSPSIVVTAVAKEANGTTANATDDFVIVVDAVADMPNLTVTGMAMGDEDTSIPLTIATSLADTDGSETLSIRITGVPADASLSAGTRNADGSYTVTQAQLSGLRLTPPVNFSGDIRLTVAATARENATGTQEITLANNEMTKLANIVVTVKPDADTPTVSVTNTQVLEDNGVTLSVQATPTDPSESLMVTIGNLQGFTIPANGLNGGTFDPVAGVWMITLPAGVAFNGGPTVFPPANSDVNRALSVTVKSTDGTDTAIVTSTLNVVVDAVADGTNVTAPAMVMVNEGTAAIPVAIGATLRDTDGSEEITSVTITGIPAGVTLSAGTRNADGSYTLSAAQLAGLTVDPGNFVGEINAKVTVNSREKVTDTDFNLNNNTAMDMTNIQIVVKPVAKTPVVTVDDGCVLEDGSITVPVSVVGQGSDSETMMVTISNLPVGWGIDTSGLVGGTVINNGTSIMISLGANANLSGGIRFTPPANSDVDSPLIRVDAVSKEAGSNTTAAASDTFNVWVDAVADAVTVNAGNDVAVARGNVVPLSISAALTDLDGSESIASITLTGIPSGVTLNKGTLNADGSYSLSPADLTGLTLSGGNFVGSFAVQVAVVNRENPTDQECVVNGMGGTGNNTPATPFTDTVQITFNNVPTPPNVVVDLTKACLFETGMNGVANMLVLPFSANFAGGDGDEVLTVTVTGLPSTNVDTGGIGTYNAAAGTWTITLPAGQQSFTNTALKLISSADSDADFTNIRVSASLRDPNNNNATTTDTKALPVDVDAVADGVNVTTTGGQAFFFDTDVRVSGNVRTVTFAAPFAFSFKDADGSESITSIVATGANASNLTNLSINGEGQLTGTLTWTGKNPPSLVNVSLQITTTDTPRDHECDLTNNVMVQNVPFTLTPVQVITPLVLDLDGNGIDVRSINDGVMFDMNNDGTLDRTAFVGGNDALLAIDKNGDGTINNQSELFGDDATHQDGFADLATLDSNGDGKITADDTAFADLRLWRDSNGDGVSQETELFSLLDFHIASIDLGARSTFDTLGADKGVITARSTFTTTDGVTHDIADVSFAVELGDAVSAAINDFVHSADDTIQIGIGAKPTIADVGTISKGEDPVVLPAPDVAHISVATVLDQIDQVSQNAG